MSEYKSFYKVVGGNEGGKCKYNIRLDTYGCGCQHDCAYCYAKSLLSFRGLWNPDDPAVADSDKIERKIKRIAPGTVVRLGGMTDCFMPKELSERVTYRTITALNAAGVGYLIVTKSHLCALDEYLNLYDPKLAHIQVTVTTLDAGLNATYEKASSPRQRIEAIRKLQDAGIDVQIRLSPFIPGYINPDDLKGLGINKALVEFLRANAWIKKWFNVDYSEYTVKQSGYDHIPLGRKIPYIDRLLFFKELTVCDDEDEAYDFWKKHVNENPEDCCNLS